MYVLSRWGYGPQLTPYGIHFKINGYTDTGGKEGKIQLLAMMVVNSTHTAKYAPEADKKEHFNTNSNTAVQEVSVLPDTRIPRVTSCRPTQRRGVRKARGAAAGPMFDWVSNTPATSA